MTYRVTVDKNACMSAGNCIVEGAEGFGFDGDELVELLPGIRRLSDAALRRIAQNCPGQAIHLFDEEGAPVSPFAAT